VLTKSFIALLKTGIQSPATLNNSLHS